MRQKQIYLFAAGGTGGHIFPALALAEEFKKQDAAAEVHFVGTQRGLETHIIPSQSYPLHLIKVGRLNNNVSALERLKTLLFMPWSLLQSFCLIIKLRPRAVIGVGGYASGPVLLASSLLGKPSFIWEPNAHPGMANRLLAPFITKAFVMFEDAFAKMKTKKIEKCGYPLRKAFSHQKLKKQFEKPLKIFVFGGSQGARAINQIIFELYRDKFLEQEVEIVHQTGKWDYEAAQKIYQDLPNSIKARIKIYEFIDDMPSFYQWADLAICRAGMGTVAELSAMAVPAIFIPLPSSADNHQVKNAESLYQRGAAEIIYQKDFNVEQLKSYLQHCLTRKVALQTMSQNMRAFYQEEAAYKIVTSIMQELY